MHYFSYINKEDFTIAKNAWDLRKKNLSRSQIANKLGINRTYVSVILKYTDPSMYITSEKISKEFSTLEKKITDSQEYNKETLDQLEDCNKKNEDYLNCLDSYKELYIKTVPFKKFIIPVVALSMFIAFATGGLVEKKIFESFGHKVTIEELFPPL